MSLLTRFTTGLFTLALPSLLLLACSEHDSSVGGATSSVQGTEACKNGDSKPSDDGCNTCSCLNGQWACTEKACGGSPVCKDGESKMSDDGCNTCGCVGGQWACTTKACVAECKVDGDCGGPTIAICDKCADGSETCMRSVCNAGKCGTVMPTCPAPVACKPGEQKPAPDGCNTCTCGDDGTWGCTKIGCNTECTGPIPPCAPPPPGCDYVGGGCVNGQWTCGTLSCTPQCKTNEDCGTGCSVCPGGETVCAPAFCVDGQCAGATIGCPAVAPGQPCQKPGAEAPADDGCNTCTCGDSGTWGCTKIACANACKDSSECTAVVGIPCQQCKDGSAVCPEGACIDGKCQVIIPSCPEECTGPIPPCAAPPPGCDYVGNGCVNGQWTCGTLSCPEPCAPGEQKPAPDGCNTCTCTADGQWACTEKGCAQQCKDVSECPQPPPSCIDCGNGQFVCPSAECLDGTCAIVNTSCPDPIPACKLDADCPQPGSPCHEAVCQNGQCTLVNTCPTPCAADSDCPQPDGPCVKCLGTNPCAKAICDQGFCAEIPPICGDVCPAQAAAGEGACDMFFGFAWNGKECLGIGGCSCAGADCGNLYTSKAICESIHSACN